MHRCDDALDCRKHWRAQGVALLFAAHPRSRYSVLGIFQHLHLLQPIHAVIPSSAMLTLYVADVDRHGLEQVRTNWLRNISTGGAVLFSNFGLIILRPGIRKLQLFTTD